MVITRSQAERMARDAANTSTGLSRSCSTDCIGSIRLVDRILRDHGNIYGMYSAFNLSAYTLEERRRLVFTISTKVFALAAKKELVVEPLVRSILGPAVADNMMFELEAAKVLLDNWRADEPEFESQCKTSLEGLMAKLQEEEETVLTQLSAAMAVDEDWQLRLGLDYEVTGLRLAHEAAQAHAASLSRPELPVAAHPAPRSDSQPTASSVVDTSQGGETRICAAMEPTALEAVFFLRANLVYKLLRPRHPKASGEPGPSGAAVGSGSSSSPRGLAGSTLRTASHWPFSAKETATYAKVAWMDVAIAAILDKVAPLRAKRLDKLTQVLTDCHTLMLSYSNMTTLLPVVLGGIKHRAPALMEEMSSQQIVKAAAALGHTLEGVSAGGQATAALAAEVGGKLLELVRTAPAGASGAN